MTTALRIPDRLAHIVVSEFGDVGRDWLARLPRLVADAAGAWQLQVGAPFEPGGNVGWVAPVRRADGSDAALKVECPGHRNPWAARGLHHWAGRGAARLLDSDEASQVLLLERCVPGTNGDELDVATGNEVVASVLAELHAVEPPAEDEFEPLAMLVERFRETMWDRFDRCERPVDRGVVAQADELFTSLTSSSTDIVLLHGDLGPGNVVLSQRGWLAIDPYPMLGDRAFDVKQVLSLRDLRDAREQVAFFADRLDLDARRIAGWTFACCVKEALRCRSVGDARGFRKFLDRTEQLSSQRLV
ncbi:streptomycin 6-kinase [Actinopolymorpha cephalotaxi]|uniref:Streptomycin 6-kinase n=1 Tax=Actinopolymorpha cephalotaxi TaxID=504797 RepID=A0A1I2NQ76_9ACTN|nr:aminoglycoside phosphotransferase family protein [Actinopolymorpha cephalotaxi]NYH85447.1 streptomycin 6-kinase [Actinopolymorpha cephalotaxi]SFG04889.1 streptomycin 6-kinase [Actinopolymorpha cephalotaxi]